MSWRVELVSPRERRTALVVLVALAALGAAAILYARPAPRSPAYHQPLTVAARFFISPRQGWMVPDGVHNHLYVTHDGGRTWIPDGGLPDGVVVSLVFDSSQAGLVAVREDGSYGRLHELVTVDGGAHWLSAEVARTPPPG